MGRRPLPPEELRSAVVRANMTQLEFAHLHYVASRLGLSGAEFVRYAIETVYDGFIEAERKEKKLA